MDFAEELLALALRVAQATGAMVLRERETADLAPHTKSTPTDVVTALDTAAEQMITELLLAARPADGLLGEEGAARTGTSGVRWVVDPIDGTVNFLYGIPQWAVCIAAEIDGEPLVGVVREPSGDRTWTAVRGRGAWRDGRPIRCSSVDDLSQALVATGFSYAAQRRAEQGAVAARLLPQVRDIRRMGSGALDLCAAGEGLVDAYFESGLQPWDLAAAGLIAREAGCRVEGLHGAPAGADMVIAAPTQLFDAVHSLITS